MSGFESVATPDAAPSSGSGWDAVATPDATPKMPDMSGVQQTAAQNLQVPKPDEAGDVESKQESFSAKIDKAAGAPVSAAIANTKAQVVLPPDMRSHLVTQYKNGTATDVVDFMQSAIPAIASVASPQASEAFSPKQIFQNVIRSIAPIVGHVAKSGEAIQEGVNEGAQFKPFGEGGVGTVQGLANAPLQAVAALPGVATHLAQQLGEQVGYKGGGADVEAGLMAAGMLGVPHPEMQELVGAKMGKPAEAVTHNDIAQAIRMGFEDKGIPKAQDFKDTAAVIQPVIEKTGDVVGALHDIYEKAGVSPDKVMADAQINPQVAESVAKGEIPKVYEPLIEKKQDVLTEEDARSTLAPKTEHGMYADVGPKVESMDAGERNLRLNSLNKKMEAAIITPREMAEREILSEDASKKQEYQQVLSRRDLSTEHQEIESKFGVPETMNASQLGKLDSKIQSIFSDKKQTDGFSDEQFSALEDYAKRVEAARDITVKQPIVKQVRNLITDESGSAQIPQNAKDLGNELKRDVLNFATPMATGSERAQAAAKDFANKQRFAQWNGARITNLLQEKFSPEELKNMWNAMDEASVHAQRLESNGMSREEAMAQTEKEGVGHFSLPEEQKNIIKAMSDWAQHSWDQAKRLGMVEGDGLPFWTPRMAAAIGEDGAWHAPEASGTRPSIGAGRNLSTTTGSLKERKYLTAEDTEAAMKKAFGDAEGGGAILVRDIRAMPLAMTRLEQAVGGRALVNEIKEMGKDTGSETVSDSPKDGYFTIDHPALQTYKPRLKMNDEGKWEMQNDAEGNPIFDKHPVYISKEFEGPLRAVLSQDSSAAYKALMELKGKSMGLIMYSPIIHNAVEWGRALPAMPGKVATFKIYFEGNRVKNDPLQMQEAINAGMVPIGSRFFNQDISSIIEQPNLTPGRSWTAKLLGGLTGEVNAKAGEAVKSAIDKMGDVWHNTLLWDRVGDLQAGIYANIRDQNIKNGMEPQAAQAMAAHIANRFAGALPMESMGNMARKMANVAMFSRSFTVGNLGVMKDMFKGLPSDVMAQLKRDVGEEGAKAASSATQRKAIAAFALDIGLMYAANSVLQDAFDHLKRDKSLGQIAQGYVDRYHKLMQKYDESPWNLLNIPADMQALSSTSTNESGKENRIKFSTDPKTGTDYYMRMPTGKMGEEFEGWATSPLEMARKKTSQIVKPAMETFNNSDSFGHPIYDKDAKGFAGAAQNIGKVVTHLMEAQIPEDSIKSAYNLLSGQSKNKPLDYMKTLAPLGGITFSKGYPGGPEAGILAATSRRHEAEVGAALPQIKEAVESDNEDKARDIMDKLDMTTREQRSLINHYSNPQGKVNPRSMQKFERIATPEEKDLMESQQ